MSAGGTDPPFQLSLSESTSDRLRRLFHRAIVLGVRDQFARSMAEIETALKNEPRTWAVVIETFEAARATRHKRAYKGLVVQYAVHLDRPVVWLTSIEPARGSPLWLGEG
jgi:hypothetical protein